MDWLVGSRNSILYLCVLFSGRRMGPVSYTHLDVYKRQTSYRPGTRFAAGQLRCESEGIETYSPLLDLDLEDFKICDLGDVNLSNGNTIKCLEEIKEVTKEVLEAGKKPLMIGGEHLVTLPVMEALFEKYQDIHVLHKCIVRILISCSIHIDDCIFCIHPGCTSTYRKC